MLDQKDLQSIGELLDKKLDDRFKVQEEKLDKKLEKKIDEKFDEMATLVNKGFSEMQEEFDGLKGEFKEVKGELKTVKEEIKLRPTTERIFEWADGRLLDLELRADRHDYLHVKELDKLPPQPEISRILVEKGFKKMK